MNLKITQNFWIQVGIAFSAILLYVSGLGVVHLFDWDEINFAESAREMLVSGDYLTVQVNFKPFWEKPPLFIWFQVLSMKLFGVNEFAARFPNAICGVVTLLVLFNIGRKIKNVRLGLLWVLVYACSVLPFFFFKSGIIDPCFNLFIFLGIYFFILFTYSENIGNAYWQVFWSAFFLGLAVLTKGPVGFLIFLLTFTFYLAFNKFKLKFRWSQVVLFFAVLIFVGGFWFILQIVNGNFTVIQDFIVYQIRLFETKDAGHGGFFLYHFVVLFIGVFPASVFALPAFCRAASKNENNECVAHFFRWMMILFWVVLILFSIVRTKIVHYSSMCYFPLTFFAAWQLDRILSNKACIQLYMKILISVLSIVFSIAITLIPFFDSFKIRIMPYMDEFTQGNMQAVSSWYGFEWIIGLILFLGFILFLIYSNKYPRKAVVIFCLSSLIFVFGTMYFVTPQVEKYSQLSAIEFYQNLRGEDCYILPYHKSYAHYFYADMQPENNNSDSEFLCRGAIDKPCYFVLRDINSERIDFERQAPDATCMYRKNGFAFYKRLPLER